MEINAISLQHYFNTCWLNAHNMRVSECPPRRCTYIIILLFFINFFHIIIILHHLLLNNKLLIIIINYHHYVIKNIIIKILNNLQKLASAIVFFFLLFIFLSFISLLYHCRHDGDECNVYHSLSTTTIKSSRNKISYEDYCEYLKQPNKIIGYLR